MVAPHVMNQLTRSLVRVPNSGAEKPHEVNLLDLSRVSPAAALVQTMHDLPPNLFTSRRHAQSGSTHLPTDCDPAKPSQRTIFPSTPQPSVGNGLVHQRTASVGVSSGLTSGATATSSVELEPRAGFRRGTFLSHQAANGNVTPSTTPAALSPAGSRKRPLPVVRRDAARAATASTTVGKVRSAKVLKTTAANPGQQPRPAPSRRRATKEQLLREMDQLRAENEALRSGYEAYRNFYLSMVNQRRLASMGGTSGLQIHRRVVGCSMRA